MSKQEKSNSKFFTNHITNTLFDKFKGIIEGMSGLHSFHAVVGYFRSSGYFKIRSEFEKGGNPPKIQILIGINIDNIFRKHNKTALFLAGDKVREQAYEQYKKDFIADVKDAGYYEDIEKGILMLVDDIESGRVELRIHPTRDLHAKFYLFLPEKHTPHSDGWVIMGSSNLSESGLGLTQPPKYELNVAMKDYDDVAFCKSEFDTLWKSGLQITFEDIKTYKEKTHLSSTFPTPYELYMKLLIEYFGDEIDDDFTLDMPDDFMDLKYQKDAVSQGFQMLKKHNGFFLADVVGLGKTVIATMIAKRFIEENGVRDTKILVVYPPALEKNWKNTFKTFKIDRNAQFVSCGLLDNVLEGEGYSYPEEFDMILVDEAHRFRADTSIMYDQLQRICKTDRENVGRDGSRHKKIMLISATPLNNRPDDLQNLLLLFQDQRCCTIDAVPNIQKYFAPIVAKYKSLISPKNAEVDVKAVDDLYNDIRTTVIDKVTVRRTRNNIQNNDEYMEDITKQGIIFPDIERPRTIEYFLEEELKDLFKESMSLLTDRLQYARYKAISALDPKIKDDRYKNADQITISLESIYKNFMVKRLESSFEAFRNSLRNLRTATQVMVDMFDRDEIIIAPDLKINELRAKGMEWEDIMSKGVEKYKAAKGDFVYQASDFDPEFIETLKYDITLLDEFISRWERVKGDPKLDGFIQLLGEEIFDKKLNPMSKLVIFSESKDTVGYLETELSKRLNRTDILAVSSSERKRLFETIQENFDANHKVHKNDYNIIITTDVLAEGVNLHMANVIVNYDTPWNSTRLMQRIGRVNRIGSKAGVIVNYMFYPSTEGDEEIKLYKKALIKLQGFHSAYGEDSQIYSREEIVNQFELYNAKIGDDVDTRMKFLREARSFRDNSPEDYERVKELPVKSRTGRSVEGSGKKNVKANSSLVYIKSSFKQEYYKVENNQVIDLSFLDAAELFKATIEEQPMPIPQGHYGQVSAAFSKFDKDITTMMDEGVSTAKDGDNTRMAADRLLKDVKHINQSSRNVQNCEILAKYIELGKFTALTRELARVYNRQRRKNAVHLSDEDLVQFIARLTAKYHKVSRIKDATVEEVTPSIIISETFV